MINSSRSIASLLRRIAGVVTAILAGGRSMDQLLKSCTLGIKSGAINMNDEIKNPVERLMGLLFRAHPWHGVTIGKNAPAVVTTFIEVVPSDTVKYELDKATGILKVDRPQKFSNVCPTLYGFIPRTFCHRR